MENKEREYTGAIISGFKMLFVVLILIPLLAVAAYMFCPLNIAIGISVVLFILFILGVSGYFIQEPNEARVLLFFGRYQGTCRRTGYFWVNPLMTVRKISLRLRNLDIQPIKVNDKVGNPVLIGMVLVWKVKDTYRASFDVDAQSLGSVNSNVLNNFVRIQSDAALREVTGKFAYDSDGKEHEMTLRGGGDEINHMLETKINERLAMAGIEVEEARINYLAYAPEIAAVMLRRQQASAIISAREKIVEGAVSMVKLAIEGLEGEGIVKLNDERKASLVSNLLVVLCADEPAQPVISTASVQE
ncbi:MAG: SPFH domain-containing protein [Muribaculaceae bacterium]|nr:SPFH domain-containing protein [Muribaculaceae bacterium]